MKKNPNSVICLGAFALVVLVTWPRMWPDGIITGVTSHEKVETREITLNQLKMMRLNRNKFP